MAQGLGNRGHHGAERLVPRKVGLNLPDCGLESGQSRRNGPVGDVESAHGDRHKSSKCHVETPPGAVLLGPRQEHGTGNVILTETTGFTARSSVAWA